MGKDAVGSGLTELVPVLFDGVEGRGVRRATFETQTVSGRPGIDTGGGETPRDVRHDCEFLGELRLERSREQRRRLGGQPAWHLSDTTVAVLGDCAGQIHRLASTETAGLGREPRETTLGSGR